jgi:hypothetical protein
MLAELAAANAAYQVIKTTLANGGELMSAGQHVAKFFESKEELQKTVNKKGGKKKSELEEFLALEELKAKEEELKQWMIYSGRPGLHTDWINFQVQRARERKEEQRKKMREKIERQERWAEIGAAFGIGLLIILGILASFAIGYFLLIA